ncbi:MAG: tRNA pseudouridine(38-40) synthase TruA [Muribaculaceae bacterium]|jgi:tRNA pseudouridine38-40 synthase|nr:tRNA pseudouridine(38-40) synthase TruA [Muribaculaceae bacterium]MBQ4005485.1 tRNA pseudouridine(38-40) synthase TruA [Muribaculaceae bacterium]
MRYFMQLSYRGAQFHGWQVQPHDPSVQQAIEEALAVLLHTPTPITGAGRTDTGVNARKMIAHFDTAQPIADTARLVHSLNGMLCRDIAIQRVWQVDDNAHARFDATSRTYKYYVHEGKNPFAYPLSWQCPPGIDFDLMNEAAACLLRYRDFTSFSKLHTDVKTNNCTVTHARWERDEHGWVFTITADRFLRNMVRAVVGTLVEVGRHKITVEEFCHIIERRDRCAAGTSMPAHALFLHDVTY